MVGGSSDPAVPRSPGVTLQEGRAAHGPLHPAVTSPPRLSWFCVWFCWVSLGWMLGILFGSLGLWGWNVVWFVALLGPDPCMPRCLLSPLSLSLSLSMVGIFVGAVPLSLSLSISLFLSFFFSLSLSLSLFFFLSGAVDQTLKGVWDSPCVSSSWTRTTTSICLSSFSPSPKGVPAPPWVFFVIRRRSRGCFSGVFLAVLSVCLAVCVGFFLWFPWFLSWSFLLRCMQDVTNALLGKGRRRDISHSEFDIPFWECQTPFSERQALAALHLAHRAIGLQGLKENKKKKPGATKRACEKWGLRGQIKRPLPNKNVPGGCASEGPSILFFFLQFRSASVPPKQMRKILQHAKKIWQLENKDPQNIRSAQSRP